MDMLRGHIGSLSLRPALLTHLLHTESHFVLPPQAESSLGCEAPHTLALNGQVPLRALIPHAIAAAGSAE